MNTNTFQIYEGPEAIKEAKERGEPLIRIPEKHIEKLHAMNVDDRKAYAKRLRNRRKAAKRKRKAERKRRGRRAAHRG